MCILSAPPGYKSVSDLLQIYIRFVSRRGLRRSRIYHMSKQWHFAKILCLVTPKKIIFTPIFYFFKTMPPKRTTYLTPRFCSNGCKTLANHEQPRRCDTKHRLEKERIKAAAVQWRNYRFGNHAKLLADWKTGKVWSLKIGATRS